MEFAIIETGGKQYKVKEGSSLKIEKLDLEVGKPVVFDKVLLSYSEKGGLTMGKPFLEGVSVQGEVVEQDKAKKVIIFKYKPKKRYRKKTGHRQHYTLVKITGLGGKKKAVPKAPVKTAKKNLD